MYIELNKDLEDRVNQQVEAGIYSSVDEMINDGLKLLFEKEEKQKQFELLKSEVSKGLEQLQRGEKARVSALDIFDQVVQERTVTLREE